MIYWGIRRKSDGAFLPQGRGRGFTHDVPTFEKPPRLFMSRSAAERALDCWLLGEWHEVPADDWNNGPYPEPPRERPEDRCSDDMEVVVLTVEPR